MNYHGTFWPLNLVGLVKWSVFSPIHIYVIYIFESTHQIYRPRLLQTKCRKVTLWHLRYRQKCIYVGETRESKNYKKSITFKCQQVLVGKWIKLKYLKRLTPGDISTAHKSSVNTLHLIHHGLWPTNRFRGKRRDLTPILLYIDIIFKSRIAQCVKLRLA